MRRSEYELRKISDGVFDKSTILSLQRLNTKGIIDEIKSIISTGKEANVYHGYMKGKEIAIKIYAVDASEFKNMEKYILGDKRFKAWRNRRQLIYNWAQKEFKNLSRVCDVIDCPKPFGVYKNILVMEFIGKNGIPAPRMKDLPPDNPKKYFDTIIQYMKNMYKKGIVHADLSEYNILNAGKPVIIDLSTGVLIDHPNAEEFLQRDVRNICNYFKNFGLKISEMNILKEIKGEE
ncbi:MAG: serine protein kinase RIO [Candidatus Altiarchaeales archaeon]|nr:MAG: serine protein kinase RIO [Candidatus Altiarchaeales archaeon]